MASTNQNVNLSSQDMIAILDSDDYSQLFPLASPMKVTVRETAKPTSFKVEDGSERTDNIVFDPVEIEIPFLLTEDTRAVFANIKKAFRDQTQLIVQTKVDSYPRMSIFEMPHDETSEQGDSILVTVKLKMYDVVKAEYGTLPPAKVANKSQSSTVNKGQQQTTESDAATKRKGSVLAGIFK